MKREEWFISSTAPGRQIHCMAWIPKSEPKGVLQLVHGMIEHIGRYERFAIYLASEGYAVIGHDHLGHGGSMNGEPGFFAETNGTEAILGDIWQLTQEARRRWPDVPNYILGHSMGSFFLRRYLTMHSKDVCAAIIMGTGWHGRFETLPGKMLCRLLCKLYGNHSHSKLIENLTNGGYDKVFKSEGHNAWLSRNPKEVKAHNDDQYCQFHFTTGAYYDFFRCMDDLAQAKDFKHIRGEMPLLIISGSADPVGGKRAVMKVMEQLRLWGAKNIQTKLYPEARHEILNELNFIEVYQYLLSWLNVQTHFLNFRQQK